MCGNNEGTGSPPRLEKVVNQRLAAWLQGPLPEPNLSA